MSKLTGNPNGRPLMYKTNEELSKSIDEYFDYCDNRIKQVHSKEGETYAVSNPEPYTMSGLAYALGMERTSLIAYKTREEFSHTIKRARARVEADVERRMNDKETFTPGLIFNLKNNFGGWKDKTESETTHILPKPIMELDAPTDSPIIHIED
jgi:hypothetical protein